MSKLQRADKALRAPASAFPFSSWFSGRGPDI